MNGFDYAAHDSARRMQKANELSDLLTDESRVADELQAKTGCTRTAALLIAKNALNTARHSISVHPPALAKSMRPMGEHFTVKSTLDAGFEEFWSLEANARERCEELNRNLAHPAYFIA